MRYFVCWLLPLSLSLFSCQNSPPSEKQEDPSGTWSVLTTPDGTAPIARHEAAFIGAGDKFYLLGGRGERPASIYDPKKKSWQQGGLPPVEMHHFQPVVFQNEIWIIGAFTGPYPGETPIPVIYMYNPEQDSWREGPDIPEDRRRGGAGVVVYQNKLYLVCGIKDGHRGDHKNWLDSYDPATGEWVVLPDAPRARDHFQAVVLKDKLYVMAGRTTISEKNPFKHTIGSVDVYDFKTQSWSTLEKPLPTLRAGNIAIPVGEEIWVMGGESFAQEPAHSEVEALNVNTNTWRTLPPMPQGRHGTGAILVGNKLYLASGCGNRGGNPELSDLIVYEF